MAQRKRNIEFSKPDEPSFLKKLKNQIGIQQDLVTIESKKEKLMKKDLDYRDEEPVYVLEEDSGVTEKELENFKEQSKQEKEYEKDNEITEQRIIFRKPVKTRTNSEQNQESDTYQSTAPNKPKPLSKNDEKLKNLRDKSKVKMVKNSSLLSFNDDDEDEA